MPKQRLQVSQAQRRWRFFHERSKNVPKLFGWFVLALVSAYFSFVTDMDLHNESFLTWPTPHTHLAWSVFLFSGVVRGLRRLCTGCEWVLAGLRHGSLRTPSSVWARQGAGLSRVTEHWGAFRAPSFSAWKADPQWSLFRLYGLHRHSDCALKMGVAPSQCRVLTMKDSGFVVDIHLIIPTVSEPVSVFSKVLFSYTFPFYCLDHLKCTFNVILLPFF